MPSVPSEPAPSQAGGAAEGDPLASAGAGTAALRGSALRGGSYAATILLSLISAPLLIRHLGIVAFGRYTTVTSIVTIIGGLFDAGLLNVALREWVTRSGPDRLQAAQSMLGLRLLLSGAGVGLGVAFAALAGYRGELILGTLFAGAGMVLQAFAHLLTVPLQGDLRFGWASLIDLARQFVAVLLIVVLVLLGASLLPFLAVMIPSGLAMVAAAALLVRGRMPLVPRLRGLNWWPLLRDSLPYAASVALNTVYFRVTIVVMSLIASSRQTGYFATSFRVTEVLVGVPALAVGAAFPILSHAAVGDPRRFTYATGRILVLSLLAGVGLALAVVLSAPFVIQVLAGGAGRPAVPVLQIQGIALIATFLANAGAYSLLSLHRHRDLLLANGAALAANVGLTLMLVPTLHARGAAIAAVVAESALAVGQVGLLLRAGGMRPRLDRVPPITLAAAVGFAPLLIPGIPALARTAMGLAGYTIVLFALQQIPPELRELLQHRRDS